MELGGVNGTETSVTGLTPGVYYTFSVTAENAVFSQDNNINARTVRATANTEEGGMRKQLHCINITHTCPRITLLLTCLFLTTQHQPLFIGICE